MNECRSVATVWLAVVGIVLAGAFVPASAQTGVPPVISALNPTSAQAGDPGFTLSVSGSNFVAGSTVIWNTIPLVTAFVNPNQLTATVGASLVATPGTVFITVRNPEGTTSTQTPFMVTATPLSITTTSLPPAVLGSGYTANLQATGGLPPYTWSAVDALPPGLTLSATGAITGTPNTIGTFSFTVRVTDQVSISATRRFSLDVTSTAQVIITNASPLPAGTVGIAYTVTFTATGGTAPFGWSITAGTVPDGLTLNAATGVLSGTPLQRGEYSFTLRVGDAVGGSTTKVFAITINTPALTITTAPPLFNGTVGVFYSQNFLATGGLPPYRWTISGQTPPGLSFDTANGSLTGTPTAAGTYNLTVRVNDSATAQAERSYTVTVDLPRLTIVTSTLPGGMLGTSYSQQLTATGGSPPYRWTITSGQVPGLSLNTNTGVLSGTPTSSGTFSISVQVRDIADVTSSRTYSLTVDPAPLVLTASTQLPPATVGVAYQYQFTASGGVAPYTWTANGLPEGLTMDATTGVIRGTPVVGGTISFTVRVMDSGRLSATDLFRVTIALPVLPAVSFSGVPETTTAAQQINVQLRLAQPYLARVIGKLTLSFTPETGAGDSSIQFSSGGRTADFTINPGETDAKFTDANLAFQTGTVAGTIRLSATLASGEADLTPSPAPAQTIRIARAAPVLRSATLTRTTNGFSVRITGYATSLEVTQAVFRFRVASGNTLQQSEVTVPVETLFTQWYQDPNAVRFGSQFLFTQQFTVSGGDATLVTPESVTLTNRVGSSASMAIQ